MFLKPIKIFLLVFLCTFTFNKINAQVSTYTFIDPCTKEVTLFSVPLQGGKTTIIFLNNVGSFDANDLSNGTFSTWVNNVYTQYRQTNPCSQQQGQVTQNQITTQIIGSTVQSIVSSILSSSQSQTSNGEVSTGNGGGDDAGGKGNNNSDNKKKSNGTNNTNGTSTGSSTNQNGGQSQSGSGTNGSNGGSNGSQGNGNTEGSGGTTGSGNSTEGGSSSSQPSVGGNGSSGNSGNGGGSGSTGNSGGSGSGTGNSGNGTNSNNQNKEEVGATTTMNNDAHNDNGSGSGGSSSGGGSKGGKSGGGGARSNPIIVSSDLTNAQNLNKSYTPIINIGTSRSSMTGKSSVGVTGMVWLNFNQYALSARYTRIHYSKTKKIKYVHNLNLTGVYTYGNYLGFLGYSGILNAGKWGITGFNISGAVTIISEDKSGYYSPSMTAFYTRPFKLGKKLIVSPEIYVISTPLVYSTKDQVSISDRYFSGFIGTGVDYQISKRFKLNMNYKANLSTNPAFPILSFFLIGSKINL